MIAVTAIRRAHTANDAHHGAASLAHSARSGETKTAIVIPASSHARAPMGLKVRRMEVPWLSKTVRESQRESDPGAILVSVPGGAHGARRARIRGERCETRGLLRGDHDAPRPRGTSSSVPTRNRSR